MIHGIKNEQNSLAEEIANLFKAVSICSCCILLRSTATTQIIYLL